MNPGLGFCLAAATDCTEAGMASCEERQSRRFGNGFALFSKGTAICRRDVFEMAIGSIADELLGEAIMVPVGKWYVVVNWSTRSGSKTSCPLLINLDRAQQRLATLPSVDQARDALARAEANLLTAAADQAPSLLAQVSNSRNVWRLAQTASIDALVDYYSAYYRLKRAIGEQ